MKKTLLLFPVAILVGAGLFSSAAESAEPIEGSRDSVLGGPVADSSLVLPGGQDLRAPGTPTVCRERRHALAAELEDGVMFFHAGEDVDGRFESDVDFHYLAGLHRPGARLLLVAKDGKLVRDELYLPVQSPQKRLWEGPQLNPEDFEGSDAFGRVFPAAGFDEKALIEMGKENGVHSVGDAALEELVELEIKVKRARTLLNNLQVVKTPGEIAALEMAVDITQAAIADAMRIAVPGTYEYQAEAAIDGGFRRRGSEFRAFPSICGSAENACFLHYRANNRLMQDGDLLLMDVGAKYEGYSADVTRTFPINGKFTKRQRELYEMVLEAQTRAVAALKPGVTMRDVHKVAADYFAEKGVRQHFKHGLGHQLGIRVHDVPGFRGKLKPGMLVTIEPGLYLSDEAIGIRIEDDYLLTETGNRKLSDSIPSDPDELEAYIRELRKP